MVLSTAPASATYGGLDSLLKPTIEEHLLERVSALETLLQRANDRLEMMVDLVNRQATNGLCDQAMLAALIDHLSERGSVNSEQLEVIWRNRMAQQYEESNDQLRLEERLESVRSTFGGGNADLFNRLLSAGSDLFVEGNYKKGIRYFEKALVLDPFNPPLAAFIGEHFYRLNKPELAREYLERAVSREAGNYGALILLGVICGDDGDLAAAKQHLSRALRLKKNSFAAHYGLGRILASEGKLREAIAHLKRALTLRPTPEMYYLVGRAYLEEGKSEVAFRHLRRCVDLDPRFDAALYHLGLIYLKQNNLLLAQEHFRAAYDINPRESRYRVALRARKPGQLNPLPVFGRATVSSRKVVTSGDVRLTELLRSDLLESENGVARKGQKRS
jgi:tetratricopeptide (TPR) repeat protein